MASRGLMELVGRSDIFAPVRIAHLGPALRQRKVRSGFGRPLCAAAVSAPPRAPASASTLRINPTDPSGQPPQPSQYGSPRRGHPEPLGASISPATNCANFALFSANAAAVDLCLFTEEDLLQGRVSQKISLCPDINRTGDVWHITLPDLNPSLLYGYVLHGPDAMAEEDDDDVSDDDRSHVNAGQVFDPSKVVLDPRAAAIFNGRRSFGQLGPSLEYGTDGILGYAPTWPQAAAAVPSLKRDSFNWEGDRPLNRPMEDLVIYEAHVRGFTAHPSANVPHPGTYRGLIDKLDYLQSLGITALELMPVHEFNELEYFQVDPHATHATPGRYNFWGYSTVGYFAPMARYSAGYSDPSVPAADAAAAAVHEFKTLVKEAHRRGIEVILDVVFNHTAEGNENGLVLSFRGIDNRVYYMLAPGGECYNYSGCGNTFNCNHPVARQFILDCLRYWVEEMHVDGFRFDLASIMTRAHSAWHPSEPQILDMYESDDNNGYASYSDEESPIQSSTAPFSAGAIVNEHGHMTDGAGVPTGTPLPDPPLIAAISSDPVLSTTKLIAEAWDCDGLNQVGGFPHYGGRWSEWNGHFRDAVRQFIKGTDGAWAGAFASALCGSPGIYAGEPGEGDWWGNNAGKRWKGNRGPTASVNFITAHDGFTLADLVSYNEKHNEANGEENRDGESHNLSWNCGEEGPTLDVGVLGLRCRQQRNMLVALFLAHGVPMLLCGDEYGHSKGGNNNTYCHDSDLNYFDWSAAAQDKDGLLRFTRHLIALRRARRELRRTTYVTDDDVEWHGIVPGEPDWSESSRLVAFTLKAPTGGLYVAFNTSHSPQMLALPRWEGRVWQPVIDTSKAAPFDVLIPDARLPEVEVAAARAAIGMWTLEHAYPMLPWSCIVLESVPEDAMENMPTVLASSSTSGDAAVAKGRTTKPRSTRRKKGASGEVRKAEEQALQ